MNPDAPNGIRTRATTLKGWRPRPLVDGGGASIQAESASFWVSPKSRVAEPSPNFPLRDLHGAQSGTRHMTSRPNRAACWRIADTARRFGREHLALASVCRLRANRPWSGGRARGGRALVLLTGPLRLLSGAVEQEEGRCSRAGARRAEGRAMGGGRACNLAGNACGRSHRRGHQTQQQTHRSSAGPRTRLAGQHARSSGGIEQGRRCVRRVAVAHRVSNAESRSTPR
jgi:hypothetical protein